jgi:uncharacterized membrane protein
MPAAPRVLIAGETWVTHCVHTKGFDSFSTAYFGEGYSYLKSTLEGGGCAVDVIENHVASERFPTTLAELRAYGTVILSDIGANTLLLSNRVWKSAEPAPNRLHLLAEYVRGGGGLVMVGGYLTFMGIEGKGRWRDTAVEDVLPVTMLPHDDRAEHPEGITPETRMAHHPVLDGVNAPWPALLGYNRVIVRPEAELLATVGNDPLLVVGRAGAGRSVAFTSDCSPHWCPRPFMEWDGYAAMWRNICGWAAGAGR